MRALPVKNLIFGILVFGFAISAEVSFAASVEPCAPGSQTSHQQSGIDGSEIVLRAAPNGNSAKLINQKATEALKTTHYLTVDNTVTVIEECRQGDWSRIRVAEPEWLRQSHVGWVLSNALRIKRRDASGKVEFTEADFVWDQKTEAFKKIIVAGVNKLRRENSRCSTIDPGSASISSTKGSRSDPVFFVTCGVGNGVFNAFFSKSDIEKGTSLAAAQHIDRNRAIDLCEAYATAKAMHPSTVKFSRAAQIIQHANGRTSVDSKFTAKNSFNLETKYSIRCLLDSGSLLEASVNESGP